MDPRPTEVRPVALSEVADLVGSEVADGPDGTGRAGRAEVALTGMTLSSQQVRPGDLYAALPGARTHGARYAADAVRRGAVAALTDAEGAAEVARTVPGLPVVIVPDPRSHLGVAAALVYDHPADHLRTIGVTGTQGKTTVTYLAEAGLAGAGQQAGVIGTIGTRIAGRPVASALTTPEAPELHALLAVMRERRVPACVMEVSSHALVLGRVDAVVFDVAVFLNLGRDHLDFHETIEDYFEAKARLFTPEHARHAVVDVDDEHGRILAARTPLPTTTISTTGRTADWIATAIRPAAQGTTFDAVGPDGTTEVHVPLAGGFNVANALAVMAALVTVGHPPSDVAAGIAACAGVPGRMERVDAGQEFTALVDYAHKPEALASVLAALDPVTSGRLIVVIGAGGDRDTGKRPLMGRIAAQGCDLLVVTDDNPRSEDPAVIRQAIVRGAADAAPSRAGVVEVGGRRDAIAYAVDAARSGDCVVVAGKGHERGQEVAGVVQPFDDREVLRSLLAGRSDPR